MSKKNKSKRIQKSINDFINLGVSIDEQIMEIFTLIDKRKALEVELEQMMKVDEVSLSSLLDLNMKIDQITLELNEKGWKVEADMAAFMSDYLVRSKL